VRKTFSFANAAAAFHAFRLVRVNPPRGSILFLPREQQWWPAKVRNLNVLFIDFDRRAGDDHRSYLICSMETHDVHSFHSDARDRFGRLVGGCHG
jgi:hypothetical protein